MTEISNTNNRPEHVSVGMGIDFGTSNSTAAIFDGEKLTLVMLEDNNPIMPSASYIDRDFVTSTGQEAIDTYIARNQGRKVEMSLEVLGEARTSTDGYVLTATGGAGHATCLWPGI